MGLFDLLFKGGAGTPSSNNTSSNKPVKSEKVDETYFLDADSSTSMGNVDFMKRSNTIRRTFPGTVDNPGNKEMVAEVASMKSRLEKVSEGLPGGASTEAKINLNTGVPKPVKKTFAQTMSVAELDQRKKGSAVGVNVTGGTAVIKMEKEAAANQADQPRISQAASGKAGAIDPFRQMGNELRG